MTAPLWDPESCPGILEPLDQLDAVECGACGRRFRRVDVSELGLDVWSKDHARPTCGKAARLLVEAETRAIRRLWVGEARYVTFDAEGEQWVLTRPALYELVRRLTRASLVFPTFQFCETAAAHAKHPFAPPPPEPSPAGKDFPVRDLEAADAPRCPHCPGVRLVREPADTPWRCVWCGQSCPEAKP